METICEYEKCTGCFACQNVCPHKCIKLVSDKFGELHPQINQDLCINCGLCIKKCPVRTEPQWEVPIGCYAVWNKNEKDRRLSASGGVATCFSQYMIKNKNGIVYGVKWDKQLRPVFDKVTSISDIEDLKGSKYVQAYVNFKYKEVDVDLQSGKNVLFIGTPCQIAGLKSFLGKDYDNLLTCDLLCHGVPSPDFLSGEIKRILGRKIGLATNCRFRGNDKYNYNFSLWNNGKVLYNKRAFLSYYFTAFLTSITLRESCYSCRYASERRISDITLGDFIGLGKLYPFTGNAHNASVVVLNTSKGEYFFSEFRNSMQNLYIEKREYEEAVQGGESFRKPVKRNIKRDKFLVLYEKYGWEKAITKVLWKYIFRNTLMAELKKLLHKKSF